MFLVLESETTSLIELPLKMPCAGMLVDENNFSPFELECYLKPLRHLAPLLRRAMMGRDPEGFVIFRHF